MRISDVAHPRGWPTTASTHARLIHATFVAADEAVLSIFEAISVQAVRDASEQAGLSVDRISLAEDVKRQRITRPRPPADALAHQPEEQQ